MQQTFDKLLNERANALTLSRTQLERVNGTCREIASWFREGRFGGDSLSIYMQGSIRLRTSITPKRGGGFDADMVVELGPPEAWSSSPSATFEAIGSHLKGLPNYDGLIQRKRRCWALVYDSQYHVDITPAIKDTAKGKSSILVFDEPTKSWRSSDPLGFAAWFHRQASLAFRASESAEPGARADFCVDPLTADDWLDRSHHNQPLAQTVQLLKRCRDLYFEPAEAPNSMVLTTLAGKFCAGEQTVSESLCQVVQRMTRYFSEGDRPWEIVNPTNDTEVLSENWVINATARQSFLTFIKDTQALLSRAASANTEKQMATYIYQMFKDG
jgi:hypothetical protein